jgi:glucose dehydrogenase
LHAHGACRARVGTRTGGTLDNQRHSPLTQINRDTVGNLRAEWRASLGGSGMGPRQRTRRNHVYGGVIYVVTCGPLNRAALLEFIEV